MASGAPAPGRRRSRGARAAWVVLVVPAAVAVLVALLASRPLVIAAVTVVAAAVGALAGLALWRRRNRDGELPPLGELLRSSRLLVVPLVAVLAAAAAVFALRDGGARNAGPGGGIAPPRDVEAKYDAALTFDADTDRWAVRETADVPMPDRRHPASLGGGWTYDGAGAAPRHAVYVRARAIETEMSFWPFKRVTNVIEIPAPLLAVGRRNVVAADGSTVRLTGPRRLVGDTTPPPAERARIAGGQEEIEIALTGLRHDPGQRRVEIDVANGIGRSAIYAFVIDYGPWLLGLVISTVVAFFVNRELKRRYEPATAVPHTWR